MVFERNFRAGRTANRAHIETKEMQYLYNSGDEYYFMDSTTFEQTTLERDLLGDATTFSRTT